MSDTVGPDRAAVRASARLLTLLRLLLLTLALSLLLVLQALTPSERLPWSEVEQALVALIVVVAVASAGLAVSVVWTERRWMLVVQQVFDIAWLGGLIYLTGGVSSPITPLLFAVVLIANLVVVGVVPFLVSSISAAVLAASAVLYVLRYQPFDVSEVVAGAELLYAPRVFTNLVVQVGALYLVDAMGQALARRLHEQRLLTDDMLGQFAEGVIAIGRDRAVLYANAAAAELLRVPAIVSGGDLLDLLEAPHLGALRVALVDDGLPITLRLETPDRRHLLVRVSRLVGRRGRMVGRTILISDQTRLRDLEQDAERSERLALLGEMAAGIAHEVRNPLTSLRGCAQEMMAMQRQGSQSDGAALASIMLHEADRLARLVEDFLGMARLRSPESGPVDVAEECRQIEELVGRRTDLPEGFRLEVAIAAGLPPLCADPDQLRQVLTNLVNNAVDAVRRVLSPRVRMAAGLAEDDERMIVLTVSDNGPGIPVDRREKIFTPFYSSKSQGTGLGLTVVQRIVQQHGGLIQVDSAGEKGAAIRLRWPIWQEVGAQTVPS